MSAPAPARPLRHAAAPGALAANEAHQFAARYALMVAPSRAVYSFIPKNGCSTLRLSLAIANGAIAGPEAHTWIHLNNRTFQASFEWLLTADYAFAVLRCPFRRLASCYLDKIVGRYPPLWRLYEAMGRTVEPEEMTFRAFVKALTAPKMREADEHWRPQTDFLVYGAYDELFDLADFAAARARLKARIGLDVVDARDLTRHGTAHLTKSDAYGPDTPPLTLLNARAAGEIADPASLYDAALWRTVADLYAGDVALMAETFGTASIMAAPKPSARRTGRKAAPERKAPKRKGAPERPS